MAITFNGSSDRLSWPTTAMTTFTLSCWVRVAALPTTNRAYLVMMSNDTQPSNEWSGGLGINSSARFQSYAYDGASKYATGTTAVSLDTWYHVVGVFKTGSYIRNYLNGVQESSTVVGTLFSSWTTGPIFKAAGSAGSDFQNFLNGSLAEVGIWSVELSDAEITALSKGFSPRHIRPQSRVDSIAGVRGIFDRHGSAVTTTGTTVGVHPRVYS